nr:response regulator [Myxococcota bacterium]
APARSAGPPTPAAIAIPTLAGRRLLALDDDLSTRKLLALTLGTMGRGDVRIVEVPDEALAMIDAEHFDLAIVDAMMPTTTGLAFALAVRACERGATIPIVFLSAASQDELGWTLPANATWLRKPFRPRELLEALVRILDAGELR